MIDRSFIMLPGIGMKMESNLWSQGIRNWEDFIEIPNIKGISDGRLEFLKKFGTKIEEMIMREKRRELAILLPRRERWRMLSEWNHRYAAMDIEVSNMRGRPVPVMISIRRGEGDCETLIRGDGLCWQAFDKLLDGIDFLVTFNGSSFDIPVLKRCGYAMKHGVHIDLRHYTCRAGFHGGLKQIEQQLGIGRRRELEYSTGEEVSYLWKLWMNKGSKRSLDLMIGYNQRDTDTLIQLAKVIYQRLANNTVQEISD